MVKAEHISVCICTFKRPELLRRLLNELDRQTTTGQFSYSVIVADNDSRRSAQGVVQSFREGTALEVQYHVEPEQNIALARNKAVENAKGELIAFIDDDEIPGQDWLLKLFKAYKEFKADGILGPVVPYYEIKPPRWIIKGRFYERSSHKTGTILTWDLTRTGNALLKRDLFIDKQNMFNPEFGSGGEDRDFFRRMIGQGHQFVWSAEAPVYEVVPPERFKRMFMVKRALLRGTIAYNHNLVSYTKSICAIPAYTLLLPFFLISQHHMFMRFLVKYFDHIGRILALLKLNIVKQKYVVK